jgi:phage terminase large subunit
VTSIVYFQVYGKEKRFIDADEFYSPSIEQIYTTLTQKPYQYGLHFLPFDATVSQLTTGMSIIAQLRTLGLKNIYRNADGADGLPQQKSKMDGIKLVQTAFSSFWIDESLEKKVLEPLSNYAPKYSELRRTYSDEPEHNWASHMSDAIRYAVIGINEALTAKTKQVSRERKSIYAAG